MEMRDSPDCHLSATSYPRGRKETRSPPQTGPTSNTPTFVKPDAEAANFNSQRLDCQIQMANEATSQGFYDARSTVCWKKTARVPERVSLPPSSAREESGPSERSFLTCLCGPEDLRNEFGSRFPSMFPRQGIPPRPNAQLAKTCVHWGYAS